MAWPRQNSSGIRTLAITRAGQEIYGSQAELDQTASHIMWTAPLEEGGVVGGLNTGIIGATYYSGGSYEGRLQNAIIMNGKI